MRNSQRTERAGSQGCHGPGGMQGQHPIWGGWKVGGGEGKRIPPHLYYGDSLHSRRIPPHLKYGDSFKASQVIANATTIQKANDLRHTWTLRKRP